MNREPDDGETPYGLDWMMRGAPQPRRPPPRRRPFNLLAVVLATLIGWAVIGGCVFLVWWLR